MYLLRTQSVSNLISGEGLVGSATGPFSLRHYVFGTLCLWDITTIIAGISQSVQAVYKARTDCNARTINTFWNYS